MEEKKQIHLIVPGYIHKEVRVAAAKEGISMMQFCIRAVLEQLQNSKPIQELES